MNIVVKGSVGQYPGKANVIKDIESGVVFVSLVKEDNKLIVLYNKEKAGVVDSQKTENYEDLVESMSIIDEAVGKVISLLGTSYAVELNLDSTQLEKVKEEKGVVTYDELKANTIKSGLISQQELQEIEDYLISCGVERRLIMSIFSSYKKYDEKYQSRIPKKPKTPFIDTFNAVKRCVVYMNKGIFLRFVGEKGTGKNLLLTTLAWVYQRPLFEISISRDAEKADLLGSKTIEQEVSKDGREKIFIRFDKEALIEAMECGGIADLDEVNTADPAVLTLLHSMMDGRRTIEVPSYGRVVADCNFIIIMTMNEDYEGTVSLHEGTIDRFTVIDFPNKTSIAEILQKKFPNANINYINYCDRVYKGIADLVQSNDLSASCLTFRGFEVALEVSEDLDLKTALIDNVANKVSDKEYRQHILNMLDDILG